jgi:tRNA (guanosine-2'-O-)-methyltransferase
MTGFNLNNDTKKKLLEFLSTYISENKKQLFDKIIEYRTRHITVVLEDIYQPHNASAVLRSSDCFGIQDVHIIENRNTYEVNPDVALGSSKWLTLIKHNRLNNNTLDAFETLRKQGYRIVATTPHNNDHSLDDLEINSKTALVFGNELEGLSDIALKNADDFVKIPMYGFTESFNISVSAAIIFHHLTEKLRKSGINWKLSDDEILDIKLNWVRSVIKRNEIFEKEFFSREMRK